MPDPQPHIYAIPSSRGRRRIELGTMLGLAFFVGHSLVELLIWIVLYYGLGLYHSVMAQSLFEDERFTFSYAAEVFLAAIGGLVVTVIFSIPKLESGYRPVSLLVLAFGLGGVVTGFPWGLNLAVRPGKIDLLALCLISFGTIAAGLLLWEAAKFQIRRS